MESTAIQTAYDTASAALATLPDNIETEIRSLIRQTKISDDRAVKVMECFAADFQPFLEIKAEAEAIVVTDPSQTDLIARAKDIDKMLSHVDKSLTERHKIEKEPLLRPAQLLDGIRRTYSNAVNKVRDHLKAQSTYVERLEKERIDKLITARKAKLAKFEAADMLIVGLGTIPDDQFEVYLLGAKAAFETRKEQERIEAEQRAIDAEANEKLRQENARIAAEKAEADERAREADRKAKEAQDELDRIEREKALEAERLAAIEKTKSLAPDKEKLLIFVDELRAIKLPMLSSPEADGRLSYFNRAFQSAIDNLETAANELTGDCPF
ncbi:MAG: hypothetical protein IPL32_20130 [Chloracidobacterium sp.]|nr:hypothetical protein [Chloracidobacterium sp.]